MLNIHPEDPRVQRASATVLGVLEVFDDAEQRAEDEQRLIRAQERGYFVPNEDEEIRYRYSRYLSERAALLEVLASMEVAAGRGDEDWQARHAAVLVGLAAGVLLVLRARRVLATAERFRLLKKKLDEADISHGLPRKTFTRMYQATTSLRRMKRLREALSYFQDHREAFQKLAVHPPFEPLLGFLDEQIALTNEESFGLRRRLSYRWYSFRRRNHSAWKQSVFGLFRWAGCRIAELHQPGVKPSGAPKRITPELRERLIKIAKPGDVFLTRHDDAMSNLFLPGFWPHGALYIGSEEDRKRIGLELPMAKACSAQDPVRFLEAKSDGVRFRPAEETLEVDNVVILRPPLADQALAEALGRGISHEGKRYDFVFDFRKSDRLVCTEVVYRTYHGVGDLDFKLIESGGRLCLPAEEFIEQALAMGFKIVATAGLSSGGLLRGSAAETALHGTRCGI